VWYWQKDGEIDQHNKIDHPQTDPHIWSNAFQQRLQCGSMGKKEAFSTNGASTTGLM
jgi:hypothetical protein